MPTKPNKITMPSIGKGKRIEMQEPDRKLIYDQVYKTGRWRRLRILVLNRDGGVCVKCKERVATLVDHIIPIRDGGDAWDMGNLQSMCSYCHQKKTNAERGK